MKGLSLLAHIFFSFSFKISGNVLPLNFDFVCCFAHNFQALSLVVNLDSFDKTSHPELHQQVNKQNDEIMENRIMKMSHKIILFKLLNVT